MSMNIKQIAWGAKNDAVWQGVCPAWLCLAAARNVELIVVWW